MLLSGRWTSGNKYHPDHDDDDDPRVSDVLLSVSLATEQITTTVRGH